jgi:hypothetical protein
VASNIDIWAGYAKDRFESAAKRVDEFRNWARQLSAAVAVVIGLELTLVGRVLELKPPFDPTLRGRCLIAFLVAVGIQLLLIWWLLFVGYVSRPVRYPESPVVLAGYVLNQDAQETQRMIGAYYAKAYDRFHAVSRRLGTNVGVATIVFAISILLFFAGVLARVRLVFDPPMSALILGLR